MDDFAGLACPVCGSFRLRVNGTYPRHSTVQRRRVCKACDFRFYTAETWTDIDGHPVEDSPPDDARFTRYISKRQQEEGLGF